jgi:predicted HicB family RNase H-like nuclease
VKILKVFRVQPASFHRWKTFVDRLRAESPSASLESDVLRRHITQACATPPAAYPHRKVKADLRAFSVFLEPAEHAKLVDVARKQQVSKNLFVEAMFDSLAVAT